MSKTGFHFADLAKSERLKKVMRLMQDGKPHTGAEIFSKTGCFNPGGAMSELRRNGIPIAPAEQVGMTTDGRKIMSYVWPLPPQVDMFEGRAA